MKYVLHGDPVPLARTRHSKGRTYNPQALMQSRSKLELTMLHKKLPLLEGPIDLEVTFFMAMPPSWSQVKKEKMVGQLHTSVPDFDNLLKYILDCGNTICYKDDKLIASVSGKKIWDWYPRTELILTEIK